MATPTTDDNPLLHQPTSEPNPEVIVSPPGSSAKRCGAICVGMILLAVLTAAITVFAILLLVVGGQAPRVMTNCGWVEGDFNIASSIYTFKGVPYAAPPTGDHRWQPTVPLSKEHGTCPPGVIKAHNFPPVCAQNEKPGSTKVKGQEDCLYLDIYTPTTDVDARLPVYVFIHGGCLLYGDSYMDGYAPNEDITKELNAVLVSIQYRLNGFGFLVLDVLENRTGNYGLLDQMEALRWIRRNIGNFGGDSNKVTVMGSSSGGTSIMAMMLSPQAMGLFQRAWISSGSPVLNATKEESAQKNLFFLEKTGCNEKCDKSNKTELCLRRCVLELSTYEVVNGVMPEWDFVYDLPQKDEFAIPYLLVDGHVVVASPLDAWDGNGTHQNLSLPDVPVMIGTTAQEIDYNPPPGMSLKKTWSNESYRDYVETRIGTFGSDISDQALGLYPYTNYEIYRAEYSYTTMVSDAIVNCGNDVIAAAMARSLESPVYRYIIDAKPSSPVNAFHFPFEAAYAFHGFDIYAFFKHMNVFFTEKVKPKDTQFSDNIIQNMKNFSQHGKPQSSAWLPFPDSTALISEVMDIHSEFYHEEECKFWGENGFFEYSWKN